MILFKSVTYKNFLAAGNTPITIDLSNNSSTLIVGQNGAGKSTIIEAIVFALFNKSFRKVNKNQLINSINEKDCISEVEFSIGSVDWKVRRGIKPSIFEIYKNNKILDQSSSAVDQQRWFEQSVLKLNYKSFTQIVVLGSSTFVPFMQLTAASRREIIEDLLDIRIFSTMNVILKDRIKSSTEELKNFEREITFLKEKVNMQNKHIAALEKTAKKSISQKEDKILELKSNVENTQLEITSLYEKIQLKTIELKKFDGIETKVKKFERDINTNINLLARTEKEKKFFVDNDTCPTCTQTLSEELKQSRMSKSLKIIDETNLVVEKCRNNLAETIELLAEQAKINGDITDLNWTVRANLNDIKSSNNLVKEIESEIKDLREDNLNIDSEKEKLSVIANQGITVQKNIVELKTERRNYDLISTLLKDGGIKSMVIKKYLPVINQLINKYLQSLDFYVNFTLDEEFNESIKSRYRDDFTYASFSEGEKMRIDLALMFTWRSIAKLKNSANTNLLILDEVFDSSLDVSGTEDFLRIIRGIYQDTNIFVISHKGEILLDKFDRVLKFEKVKNFSKVSVS